MGRLTRAPEPAISWLPPNIASNAALHGSFSKCKSRSSMIEVNATSLATQAHEKSTAKCCVITVSSSFWKRKSRERLFSCIFYVIYAINRSVRSSGPLASFAPWHFLFFKPQTASPGRRSRDFLLVDSPEQFLKSSHHRSCITLYTFFVRHNELVKQTGVQQDRRRGFDLMLAIRSSILDQGLL